MRYAASMTTARTLELRRSTLWTPKEWVHHSAFTALDNVGARLALEPSFPSANRLNALYGSDAKVTFEEQAIVARRKRKAVTVEPYDQAILSGRVPTRANSYHDLMNALVWSVFPKSKRALHALQAIFIAEAKSLGLIGRRLPEHDSLAILDEGGVLILSRASIASDQALEKALASGVASFRVFGHGILESLALGSPKPMVGAIVLPCDPTGSLAEADAQLATRLENRDLPRKPPGLLRVMPNAIWNNV
jgi:Protein of unknown function (DUF3025)